MLAEGVRLQSAGDHAGAQAHYHRVLEHSPDHANAHYLLGIGYGRRGNHAPALEHLRRAVTRRPDFVDAHADLGNVLRLSGDAAGAEASYRRAVALDPGIARAHYGLGVLARHSGRLEEAATSYAHALRLGLDADELLRAYTELLCDLQQFARASTLLYERLARDPARTEAHRCLGIVYRRMWQPEHALEHYRAAQRLGAVDAGLLTELGLTLQELGMVNEAMTSFDAALALQPEFPLARWHRAILQLMLGEYSTAWQDYETRFVSEDRPQRSFDAARWRGEDLSNSVLLVYAEQGLGDEIMFASCLPEVIQRAQHCIVDCHPKLAALFRRSFPAASIHAGLQTDSSAWLAQFPRPEYQIPIGSLPALLRNSLAQFPQHRGYLEADPARIAYWRTKLATLGSGLKVGISWRGGTQASRSPLRSLDLQQLLPVLKVSEVKFVDLQYTDTAQERTQLKAAHGIDIAHWPDAIEDYDETAALLCALDLTISVCTAVIHLAGALGRPVWVMAPFSPEWRYGISGAAMPWYPSAMVFRQPRYGAWEPVIEQVRDALQLRAESARAG
jgi:tetratricopeptide (TPR) repeat protein